ncbi:uncharacterized protein [Gossypium hirsutum]|uniref:Uncharacterized protein n=1 Tax=Gossypium hirsutum TaxID=3635 RepID=A0A1U8PA52_GOSHI|nr:uncharacterized protein LOC107955891 [Gossypium hirsutum]
MVWVSLLASLGPVIARALLMHQPCHPLSLDLKGPVILFRHKFADASPLPKANMAHPHPVVPQLLPWLLPTEIPHSERLLGRPLGLYKPKLKPKIHFTPSFEKKKFETLCRGEKRGSSLGLRPPSNSGSRTSRATIYGGRRVKTLALSSEIQVPKIQRRSRCGCESCLDDHRTASAAKIPAPMEGQRSVMKPEIAVVTLGMPKGSSDHQSDQH